MSSWIKEDFYPSTWRVPEYGRRYRNSKPVYIIDEVTEAVAAKALQSNNAEFAFALNFGRRHLNESAGAIYCKLAGTMLATPIVHPLALPAMRLGNILLFIAVILHLLSPMGWGDTQARQYVQEHAEETGLELLKLVYEIPLGIIAAVCLFLVALFGVILGPILITLTEPLSILWTEDSYTERMHDMLRNARKLYATLERAFFGKSVLAPCFQPVDIRKDEPIVPNLFAGGANHLFGGKLTTQNAW